MKLPKKIVIAGKTLKVTRAKDYGGSFSFDDEEMVVDNSCPEERQLEIFLH